MLSPIIRQRGAYIRHTRTFCRLSFVLQNGSTANRVSEFSSGNNQKHENRLTRSSYIKKKRISNYVSWLGNFPVIIVLDRADGITTDLNWQKLKQGLEEHNDEYNKFLGVDLRVTDPNRRYLLYDYYVFTHTGELKSAISKGVSMPHGTFDWMGTERHRTKYLLGLTSELLRSEFDVLEFLDGQETNFSLDGVLLAPTKDPEYFSSILRPKVEPDDMLQNFRQVLENAGDDTTIFPKLATMGFVNVAKGPNDYVFLLRNSH